jgi:hypothetical protein
LLAGYTGWTPGAVPEPLAGASRGELLIALDLRPGEEGAWQGKGYLRGLGGLSPYERLSGLAGETESWLSGVAGVLEGTELESHSLATLEADAVAAGFSFSWTETEPDAFERVTLTLGDPAGGILARLPHDVRLHDERRDSPILLAFPMRQRLELRLEMGDREVVYTPGPVELENSAGRFRVSVEREENLLTVRRELALEATAIPPAMWPDLRVLLLAEKAPRNRRVLLAAE